MSLQSGCLTVHYFFPCDQNGINCAVMGVPCDQNGISCAVMGVPCDQNGISCAVMGVPCDQNGISCAVMVYLVIRVCRPLQACPRDCASPLMYVTCLSFLQTIEAKGKRATLA